MPNNPRVVGDGSKRAALAEALASLQGLALPVMINLDIWPDLTALIHRCGTFAVPAESTDALILTVLTAADDIGTLDWQVAAAGAWAFTRHAALAWAPRGVRLNVIGVGVGPPAEVDPVARGRSAAAVHAQPPSIEDVVRTVYAIAGWRSMTGQFIRLGSA